MKRISKRINIVLLNFIALFLIVSYSSCGNTKTYNTAVDEIVRIDFNEDSAYYFCQLQCDFGPRCINTPEHDECGKWIAGKFRAYGLEVTLQEAELTAFDGSKLRATNIIASHNPEEKNRIIICAHWDTRPWADGDFNEENWHTPIMGANDGASGVGVMLELARIINEKDSLDLGVDFICFDAEDYGTPNWSDIDDDGNSWALGSKYWAENPHKPGYDAKFGILLDMVGGVGANFYQEVMSKHYAKNIVEKVWKAARTAGYSGVFSEYEGATITDDHIPLNEIAQIPTIDIIPYYPDNYVSSFGPTWHTLDDNMNNIDKNTLKAVGQTMLQVIYSLK